MSISRRWRTHSLWYTMLRVFSFQTWFDSRAAAMNPDRSVEADAGTSLGPVAGPIEGIARATTAILPGLLLLVAAVLWWRRLAGAASRPLEPTALLLVGTLVAAAAIVVRVAARSGFADRQAARPDRFVAAVVSAGVLAVGAALSLPGTSPGGLILLWGLVAAEECGAWGSAGWRRLRVHREGIALPKPEVRLDPPRSSTVPPGDAIPVLHEPPGEETTQQLTRRRTADGGELLTGWVRVSMAAGQRSTNVHLAFCPSFARAPRVAVKQLAGPEARIKTVQVLPYAARFDLKLAALSESASTLLLQFSAEAAPSAASSTEIEGESTAEGRHLS